MPHALCIRNVKKPFCIVHACNQLQHYSNVCPVQAYSPLGKATRDILYNPTINKVASKHGVSNAQVLIRWSLQMGFIPLPKSSNKQRQAENLDVFGFSLDEESMRTLNGLEQGYVTAWDPTVQAAV